MNRIYLLFLLLAIVSCNQDNGTSTNTSNSQIVDKGFSLVPSEKSNIKFENTVVETVNLNTIANDGIIQGAGVAVLDINNDGLQDMFFSGNVVADQLYLNEGNFQFKNITKTAGLKDTRKWSTGAVIVDINNDGYDDIYVCKFLYDDKRALYNELWINNQNNTFTEQAKEYGIDDAGYSIMANFFDYDKDGDLDLYVCNQPPSTKAFKKNLKPTDYQFTDRLYRNDGPKKFVDVTNTAGIKNVCYSLSATTSDYNEDGYLDIYVASDYEEPDLLYQNNGDGTFTNVVNTAIKHMSTFSMGADASDINNDGHMDLFTADMVAEDNFRNKTNMSSMAVEKFWNLVSMGYHYQYMFNSLQLNNGDGTFSEIAQLAGVSKTDWSWASLFLDANQDGNKDLFVTNGIMMEIRNKDYAKEREKYIKKKKAKMGKDYKFNPLELSALAPSVKIPNKSYKNNGDLTFSDVSDSWGMNTPTWSQGMAYADFDNDGDLDLVINNMNDKAHLYKNETDTKGGNYVSFVAKGMPKNKKGTGTKVIITYGDNETQVSDITPYRGYMSSCQSIAHFGLGNNKSIDKVTAIFPDGKMWSKENIKANQTVEIPYANNLPIFINKKSNNTFFKSLESDETITYLDNAFDDYEREILIPYKMSNLGPVMASGDLDGDGNDDFYLGGAIGQPGKIYYQTNDGQFEYQNVPAITSDLNFEDGGVEFFDFDGDGDLDIYVASGGNEYDAHTLYYQDRLYINDGNRSFSRSDQIPQINISSSTICPLDYDNDGDLDLFVGGRQTPGGYGRKVNSFLLKNTGTALVDATLDVAPELGKLGMITGSQWADIDGDKTNELIISGEWMPITIFKLKDGKLTISDIPSLEKSNGLWNTVKATDVDGDGDIDLVAGNYGTNYKYKASIDAPFELYVDDFDENGSNDVYLGYVDDNDGKLYPVRGRQCSSQQMPFVEEKFENYNEFGKATVIDVLDGKLDGTNIEKAYTLAHTLFINDGTGKFTSSALPNNAQVSSVYDIVIDDMNKDGNADILCIGNFHNREVETTRSDAGVGALLLGNGKGGFKAISPAKSGISANRDSRAVALLNNKKNNPIVAVANNGSEMQFFDRVQ